jgi:DDE superfamily endonuclease
MIWQNEGACRAHQPRDSENHAQKNELKPWLKRSWCFPKEAEKVVLVLDNLNTHTPASFYEVFPPEQAKALIDRLEIHYTPKHASWLNMAEIELSVLARQGLAHNIATIEDLCQQVQSWQDHRNQQVGTVNWQFRTADARIKLKRLYPVQQPDGL